MSFSTLSGDTITFLFFVAGGVAALLVATAAHLFKVRTNRGWANAARELGLDLTPARMFRRPRLTGTFRGVDVEAKMVSVELGTTKATNTHFHAYYPRKLGLDLSITRAGLLEKPLDKILGSESGQDIKVQGEDPDKVRAFLSPSRKASIMRLLDAYPSARIGDGDIFLSVSGGDNRNERHNR